MNSEDTINQDNPGNNGKTKGSSRIQFSLRTFLVAGVAFTLGFAVRNVVTGLHPLSMKFALPSSTTAVAPGDSLIVECLADGSINRRVTILADSTVHLPAVGTVNLSGMDISAVEKTLNASYAKFYRVPGIQVYRAEFTEPLN